MSGLFSGAGGGILTGAGGGGFSSAAIVPPSEFAGTQVSVHNYDTGSAISPRQVVRVQFADGDFPSTSRIALTEIDDTPIAVQELMRSTNPQSNVASVTIAFKSPDTIATEAVTDYNVGVESGSPNTTPNKTKAATLTAIQTHDIDLQATNLSGVANTGIWVSSVNDIITDANEWSGITGYGVLPQNGYRFLERGPICDVIHAWGFFVRVADSDVQTRLAAYCYIRLWHDTDDLEYIWKVENRIGLGPGFGTTTYYASGSNFSNDAFYTDLSVGGETASATLTYDLDIREGEVTQESYDISNTTLDSNGAGIEHSPGLTYFTPALEGTGNVMPGRRWTNSIERQCDTVPFGTLTARQYFLLGSHQTLSLDPEIGTLSSTKVPSVRVYVPLGTNGSPSGLDAAAGRKEIGWFDGDNADVLFNWTELAVRGRAIISGYALASWPNYQARYNEQTGQKFNVLSDHDGSLSAPIGIGSPWTYRGSTDNRGDRVEIGSHFYLSGGTDYTHSSNAWAINWRISGNEEFFDIGVSYWINSIMRRNPAESARYKVSDIALGSTESTSDNISAGDRSIWWTVDGQPREAQAWLPVQCGNRQNQTRGMAWFLRDMATLIGHCSDDNEWLPLLKQNFDDNLDCWKEQADYHATLATTFVDRRRWEIGYWGTSGNDEDTKHAWQMNYMAWSLCVLKFSGQYGNTKVTGVLDYIAKWAVEQYLATNACMTYFPRFSKGEYVIRDVADEVYMTWENIWIASADKAETHSPPLVGGSDALDTCTYPQLLDSFDEKNIGAEAYFQEHGTAIAMLINAGYEVGNLTPIYDNWYMTAPTTPKISDEESGNGIAAWIGDNNGSEGAHIPGGTGGVTTNNGSKFTAIPWTDTNPARWSVAGFKTRKGIS